MIQIITTLERYTPVQLQFMSGGFAVLDRYTDMGSLGGGGGGGNGNGNGYSDEDLLASLASFAVEGQTERDLATIKAMLAGNGFMDQAQPVHAYGQPVQLQQPSYGQAQGLAHGYAFGYTNMQHSPAQPPPNTPTTMSISLELCSGETAPTGLMQQRSAGTTFNRPGQQRRRDVSLDRDYAQSLLAQNHIEGSSALGMDLDMADHLAATVDEGSSSGRQSHFNKPAQGRSPWLQQHIRNNSFDQMIEIEENDATPEEQRIKINETQALPSSLPFNSSTSSTPTTSALPTSSSLNPSHPGNPPAIPNSHPTSSALTAPPSSSSPHMTRSRSRQNPDTSSFRPLTSHHR